MKFWIKSLILLSLLLTAICSYFLYMELTARIERTGGEAIGTITFKKRSASRRYSDNVIWEEIEQESEIFNHDAIRTMEYSSAVIALNDGTKIELDQNTLLVVILNDKGLNINFDKGGVSAKSGSGATGPIIFNSKDATIALDKGGISLNSSDAGMNIQVSSGNAKVAVQGKELQISADEVATLKDGAAESVKGSLSPISPGQNSNLITLGRTLNVNFSWRSDSPGEVKLQISRGSDFKTILKSVNSNKTSLNLKLDPGDYYWRVAGAGFASYPVRFSILSDTRPRLIAPHNNQKIPVIEGAEMISFRWEKSRYASAYELKAARDSEMSDIVLTLTSKVNIISASALKPGRYYWTIRSVYPPEISSDPVISGPDLFELEKISFSHLKPVPLDQGPMTTAAPFNLNWKGVPGAAGYMVELSTDHDFKNIILKKNTVNSLLGIDQKLSEGRYFWRVSALFGEKNTAASETAVLTMIKPVEITLLNPSPGALLVDKSGTIRFSWRDPNMGDRYLVEVSENRDFRKIKQRLESTMPAADFKNPGPGSYFWRVFLKDSSGYIIAHSNHGEFTIPGDLAAPLLVAPEDKDRIIPGLKKRLRFEWSRIPGADEYEVQIFRRVAGLEKPLIIYSSKSNYVDIANQAILTPGSYSWVVRAKQVSKGRVTAYKESGRSDFEVEEVVLLPAPVVKNPGVIYK
jgi:hypothetical protein